MATCRIKTQASEPDGQTPTPTRCYPRRRGGGFILLAALGTVLLTGHPSTRADLITLKNGCAYEGALAEISAIGEAPDGTGSVGVPTKPIVFVVDGLRRTFVPKDQLAIDPSAGSMIMERIPIEQRTATNSTRTVGEVGEMMYISPFDEYGRRFVRINSQRGPIEIHQGITEITPLYCVVEGLQTPKNAFRWRMRVATASIPRDVLSKVIYRNIDRNNPNDRINVMLLYQQAGRYKDAVTELQGIIADFPELSDYEERIDRLRQEYARQLLDMIKMRQDAGQLDLARQLMEQFPTADIAGTILGEVGTMRQDHMRLVNKVNEIKLLLDEQIELLTQSPDFAEEQTAPLTDIKEEIERDLNLHNLARMADFDRLVDDTNKSPDQKVALAITGWLLGNGQGEENLVVALSQVEVRNLVREYLSTTDLARREQILEALGQMEGSQPTDLAKIIRNLLPVKGLPDENYQGIPGYYQLQITHSQMEEPIEYLVQLPPQYDPYRKYPCIVTLGGGTSAEKQIDWWAGSYSERMRMRMGEASQHGYIVIAPRWHDETDLVYGFTAQEHAAVLFSVQDAFRRMSIDTDRVFLTGHSVGGTAAWDIGLAHPDMWAGVLPIVASADKYIERYWNNARDHMAFYFIHGELDHARLSANAKDWNRYMRYSGFDTTVTEYLGRGHEHFHEDLPRMFEWMNLHRRQFSPQSFECVTLRPWDNFFWWVETSDFSENTMVMPAEWPKDKVNDATVEGEVKQNNSLYIKSSGKKVTVWLHPGIVDFDERVSIRIHGSRRELKNAAIRPDRKVMLEDVRRRADRQQPFWTKVEWRYGQGWTVEE